MPAASWVFLGSRALDLWIFWEDGRQMCHRSDGRLDLHYFAVARNCKMASWACSTWSLVTAKVDCESCICEESQDAGSRSTSFAGSWAPLLSDDRSVGEFLPNWIPGLVFAMIPTLREKRLAAMVRHFSALHRSFGDHLFDRRWCARRGACT